MRRFMLGRWRIAVGQHAHQAVGLVYFPEIADLTVSCLDAGKRPDHAVVTLVAEKVAEKLDPGSLASIVRVIGSRHLELSPRQCNSRAIVAANVAWWISWSKPMTTK